MKRQRVFTGTSEDLVKLFGQYSQATTAANTKSFNPVKTMDYLLEKVERSKKKSSEGTREDEGPVLNGQPVGAGQAHQDEVEITFDNQPGELCL